MRPKLRIALSAWAITAVLLLLPASGRAASGGAEPWTSLRVHQAGGDILLEAPRAFLSALSRKPTGVTLPLGHFKGRPVRMSADRLIRLLKDAPSSSESLLFTRQTDQGPIVFFARSVSKQMPPRGGSPLLLAFDMERKGAAPVHLVLPLAGSSTLARTLLAASGFQPDSDVGPLIEQGIESARELGTGPFLKAVASDASLSAALR